MQDPRDLQALIAVADHGSISAAARALHTTQPALTRRLQRTERRAGTRLLERHRTARCCCPRGAGSWRGRSSRSAALESLDATPTTGIALGACTAVAPGASARPLTDRSATRRLGLALAISAALAPLAGAVREAVRRRPGSRGQFLG